ncbi:MAG: SGNH/GDSL hydrolase family protein [Bacteroidota bacterium]
MNISKTSKLFLALLGIGYIICTVSYTVGFYKHRTANIFSSLLLYFSVFLLLFGLLCLLKDRLINKATFTNLLLSLTVGLGLLFVGELTLRYGLKIGLNHSERTGKNYKSFYKKINKEKFQKKFRQTLSLRANSERYLPSRNEFNYLHTYNKYGLRDRPVDQLLKDSTHFRIVGMGDSYTEGIGTHQDSTWLKNLEYHLGDKGFSNVVTFNIGQAGSDPSRNFHNFKTLVPILQPNLVIQALNHTDIGDISIKLDRLFRPPWWEIFYANSLFFRGFLHVAFGYDGLLLSPAETQRALDYAEQKLSSTIEELLLLKEQYGFELVLIFHPLNQELATFEKMKLDRLMGQLKDREELYVLDLMEYWVEKEKMPREESWTYFWPLDGHHNSKGYKRWGKSLADWLITKNLIYEK